jgi:Family of unknown function (DUF5994)
MTPASSHTATAAPPTRPTAPSGLRLRLSPTLAGAGILDGGWWPHSRDPDTELPELVAGWFRTMDAHMVGVTRAFQDRLALLVIPPEAAGQAAQSAMAMAADATNDAGPAEVLAAAGIVSGDDART